MTYSSTRREESTPSPAKEYLTSISPFLYETGKNSRAYCENLAAKLKKRSELPPSCRQFIQDGDDKKHDPFAGMRPGEAVHARNSLSKGRESHAQVQRRLTTGSRRFTKD